MMSTILRQLKKRRIELELKQNDMMLRVGISRQQYQRLESKGNPRLDTLELVAKGLKSELLLIPQEKLMAVKAVLDGDESPPSVNTNDKTKRDQEDTQENNPWQELLGDNE